MNHTRVLLDLDEVLVDFVGSAAELWGFTRKELEPHWPTGKYAMPTALAAALNRQVTEVEFWDAIYKSNDFWVDLKPLPWLCDLVQCVEGITTDWHIVTTPGKRSCLAGKNLIPCGESHAQKVDWINRCFGPEFTRHTLTYHKHLLANKNTVLIDDHDLNIAEFRKAGGHGIVFPTHHNSMYRSKTDPVANVKQALSYWVGNQTR